MSADILPFNRAINPFVRDSQLMYSPSPISEVNICISYRVTSFRSMDNKLVFATKSLQSISDGVCFTYPVSCIACGLMDFCFCGTGKGASNKLSSQGGSDGLVWGCWKGAGIDCRRVYFRFALRAVVLRVMSFRWSEEVRFGVATCKS